MVRERESGYGEGVSEGGYGEGVRERVVMVGVVMVRERGYGEGVRVVMVRV